MSCEVIAVEEVGDTKLVAQFEIQLIVLSTSTQLEAHVVAVEAMQLVLS